jgi:hypothetical protein
MSITKVVLVAAALAAVILGETTAFAATNPAAVQPAVKKGHRVSDVTSILCGDNQWKWAEHGLMVVRNDVFEPGVQCLYNAGDGPNLFVTRDTTPKFAWNAYPEIYQGCFYGVCSQTGGLPVRVSRIRRLRMTLWTRYPAHAIGNDSTDWWFDKTNAAGQMRHPNGAELMIWLHQNGYPATGMRRVKIAGKHYLFRSWIARQGRVRWNYIQLRPAWHSRHPSLTNWDMAALIHWCERHRLISRSWYLTTAAAGAEIVKHGAGFRILKYSLHLTG